ncbi:Uncharacterised protein [Legionella pneumophila]|nr:Uncharacterised protein [Legionella pneumophila]
MYPSTTTVKGRFLIFSASFISLINASGLISALPESNNEPAFISISTHPSCLFNLKSPSSSSDSDLFSSSKPSLKVPLVFFSSGPSLMLSVD